MKKETSFRERAARPMDAMCDSLNKPVRCGEGLAQADHTPVAALNVATSVNVPPTFCRDSQPQSVACRKR